MYTFLLFYYSTSDDARLTYVGVVSPGLYGRPLKAFSRVRDAELRESSLQVDVDRVAARLGKIRADEQEGINANESPPSKSHKYPFISDY